MPPIEDLDTAEGTTGVYDRVHELISAVNNIAAQMGDGGDNPGSNNPDAPLFIDPATGLVSFKVRPSFSVAVPWDSANFNPALWVTHVEAENTYLSIEDAAAHYLTINAANAAFLKPSDISSKFLPLTGGTVTGVLQVKDNELSIDGKPSTFRLLRFTTNGAWRFSLGLENSGEPGNNAGGNLNIWRYSDTSAVIDIPFSINRATGLLTLTKRPTWQGFTPYDSGNLNPATFQLSANMAGYALKTDLAPYMKTADADATYLKKSERLYIASLPYVQSVGSVVNVDQTVFSHCFGRAVVFPGGFADCAGSVQTPAGASIQFYIFNNNVRAGVMNVSSAGIVKFVDINGENNEAINFVKGDTMTIKGPYGNPTGLSGISLTLVGHVVS